MLRNAIVVFAIVLVLGCSGLSTSAFARSGGYGGGGGDDGFRGNHFGWRRFLGHRAFLTTLSLRIRSR
jgi:hypothetical protein